MDLRPEKTAVRNWYKVLIIWILAICWTARLLAQTPTPICFRTVMEGGNASLDSVAPSTVHAFERAVYLINPLIMSLGDFPAGAAPTAIGWEYELEPGSNPVPGSAPLAIYMENTANTTNLKSLNWATAISGMTMVHNATTALPDVVGLFYIPFVGGSQFTYTGGGLYIAFDWGPYSGTRSARVLVSSGHSLGSAVLLGAQSDVSTPEILGFSDYIPNTRFNSGECPTAITISGAISYCSNLVPASVPNVTVDLLFSNSVFLESPLRTTHSDSSGNYTLSAVPGANYYVRPSKSALLPGASGINTVDVIATQQHFLQVGTPLAGCRLTAASPNFDSVINTVDVIAIQRFYLGITTGTARVGLYKFIPDRRGFAHVVTDQTGQDFDALVFGDVAAPFVE